MNATARPAGRYASALQSFKEDYNLLANSENPEALLRAWTELHELAKKAGAVSDLRKVFEHSISDRQMAHELVDRLYGGGHMSRSGLTPKPEAFVAEYTRDLNASAAYVRAGYAPKNANVNSARLMAKDSIQRGIRDAMDARSERCQSEADAVLQELAKIGFADIAEFAKWNANGVIMRVHDKISALEKLGKHLRLFTDVLQLTPQEELRNMSDEELERITEELFPGAIAKYFATKN